jgi:glutamyl-tRNA reductase
MQQALRVGKRVHTRTGIDAAGASVVSEALAAATDALGRGLDGVRAVILGAGAMGALAAAHLRRAGAAEIVVLNRSAERAERLVHNTRRTGTAARPGPLEALADELATADLLVACTGAVGTVVARETVAAAVVAREGRPLAVCDLGLHRDVDPGVAALPGVTVVDLVTLQVRLARAHGRRSPRPRAGGRGAGVPGRQALGGGHPDGDGARAARRRSSTPNCCGSTRGCRPDPAVRDEFGQTVRRVVDKLLHTPTVQVKRWPRG